MRRLTRWPNSCLGERHGIIAAKSRRAVDVDLQSASAPQLAQEEGRFAARRELVAGDYALDYQATFSLRCPEESENDIGANAGSSGQSGT